MTSFAEKPKATRHGSMDEESRRRRGEEEEEHKEEEKKDKIRP